MLRARATASSGPFGFLLATGDVLRVAALEAAHLSSTGAVLLDVVPDHAGVLDGADVAWRPKHYLGAPVPGAAEATVNLAHVVAVVSFTAAANAERPEDEAGEARIEAIVEELRQVAEAVRRPMTG